MLRSAIGWMRDAVCGILFAVAAIALVAAGCAGFALLTGRPAGIPLALEMESGQISNAPALWFTPHYAALLVLLALLWAGYMLVVRRTQARS